MDDLEDENDINDAKTLLELLRENLLTWEDIEPTADHNSSDDGKE